MPFTDVAAEMSPESARQLLSDIRGQIQWHMDCIGSLRETAMSLYKLVMHEDPPAKPPSSKRKSARRAPSR